MPNHLRDRCPRCRNVETELVKTPILWEREINVAAAVQDPLVGNVEVSGIKNSEIRICNKCGLIFGQVIENVK